MKRKTSFAHARIIEIYRTPMQWYVPIHAYSVSLRGLWCGIFNFRRICIDNRGDVFFGRLQTEDARGGDAVM